MFILNCNNSKKAFICNMKRKHQEIEELYSRSDPEGKRTTCGNHEDDIFSSLPNEILSRIFAFVPWKTVKHLNLVCKVWYEIATDQSLWKTFFINKFGEEELPDIPSNWKKSLLNLYTIMQLNSIHHALPITVLWLTYKGFNSLAWKQSQFLDTRLSIREQMVDLAVIHNNTLFFNEVECYTVLASYSIEQSIMFNRTEIATQMLATETYLSSVNTLLCYACLHGNLQVVKALYRHGYRVDLAFKVGGRRALEWANKNGHKHIVRWLNKKLKLN